MNSSLLNSFISTAQKRSKKNADTHDGMKGSKKNADTHDGVKGSVNDYISAISNMDNSDNSIGDTVNQAGDVMVCYN